MRCGKHSEYEALAKMCSVLISASLIVETSVMIQIAVVLYLNIFPNVH